jgi:hypothetical protein
MIAHARLTMILRTFLRTSVNFHLWNPGKFRTRSRIPKRKNDETKQSLETKAISETANQVLG